MREEMLNKINEEIMDLEDELLFIRSGAGEEAIRQAITQRKEFIRDYDKLMEHLRE